MHLGTGGLYFKLLTTKTTQPLSDRGGETMKAKVIKIDDGLEFDNGYKLYSHHTQDCCENHYLNFADLTLEDFEGLEFDLLNEDLFERVPDYGIRLKPINGFPVSIPGYGSNTGYYSSELQLVITNGKITVNHEITECQDYTPH